MFVPKNIKFKQIRKGNLRGNTINRKKPYIGKFGLKVKTLGKLNMIQLNMIQLFLKKKLKKTKKF